ncbi:MAG: hypothetical protein LC721_11525 [Actinobacteria bacterium]|nr:hypothetical protein [Actinomycetota bacterium]
MVKLAEVSDVSTDYLLVANSPRRPFRGAEDALGERLGTLGELSSEDLALLVGFLDALVTKRTDSRPWWAGSADLGAEQPPVPQLFEGDALALVS